MTDWPERVLVVGAGPAGLAVTAGLLRSGYPVDLVERRRSVDAEGTGILLTANALRALDDLGCGPQVRGRGLATARLLFTDEAGAALFRVDVEGAGWPAFVSIHRAALQRTLLEAVAPLRPRYGCGLEALHDGATGIVAAFSDGTRGHYGLVVGADGVHSRVRQLAFSAGKARPLEGFGGWRLVARRPAGLEHAQYMLGNGRTFLLHPLPDGRVYCGAGPVHDSALAPDTSDREQLERAFAGFKGPAREVLAALDRRESLVPTRYWHIEQRPWHGERVVLVGDAAHACAPTLSQGGAMAFEDAVVLANRLAQPGALRSRLADYESTRRARTDYVQRRSLQRMRANLPISPEHQVLRNRVLARVGADALIRTWKPLMEQSHRDRGFRRV